MTQDEKQERFLKNRRCRIAAWRWVGPLCLLMIFGLFLWLYVRSPLLVNPFEVLSKLHDGTMDSSMLTLMAVMLPIMFLACLGLLIAVIMLVYAAFINERKYLKIIDGLDKAAGEQGPQ